MPSATVACPQPRKRSRSTTLSSARGRARPVWRRRLDTRRSTTTTAAGSGSWRWRSSASNRGFDRASLRSERLSSAPKRQARRRRVSGRAAVSPDQRAFVLVVDRALRRARLIAVAEAAVWGFAAATISMTAAVAVGVAVAALRLIAVSRSGIVRALERALPDARNLFVTADEISRRQLAVGGVAADRVFAGASSRAQLVNLRRACPSLPFWYAAIFAGLAWTIALIVRDPHGPAQMLFPSRPAPAAAASDRRMTIAVIIRPPAYTGLPDARSTDPAELRAVEGSVAILSIDAAADRMTVEHDGDTRTLARGADGRFSDRMRLTKTGFVAVASDAGDRRSLPIVVTPDALPSVRVTSPARDLVYAGGSASIAFAAHATDDFGLRSLSLRYTKVSGSGEEYAFTEGEIPDRKSTRLNSSHIPLSRMPSSA